MASTSAAAAARKPVPKPSNPYENYSTAQSLGYTDPDAERIAAELEVRRSQGVAGQWEIIAPPAGTPSGTAANSQEPPSADSPREVSIKREAEAPVDEDDTRAFKLRKKTVVAGLGEIYDPGLIPIKIKKKELKVEPEVSKTEPSAVVKGTTSDLPKWTPTQWKRARESSKEISPESDRKLDKTSVKREEGTAPTITESGTAGSSKWAKPQWSQPLPGLKQEERQSIFGTEDQQTSEPKPEIKTEPDVKTEAGVKEEAQQPPPSGSLFKKRKTPAGANKGRRDNI